MKVREENALNVARIEAHFVDISCTGVAGVKHKKLLACNDQGAWAAALVIRHGGACATHGNVQTIGKIFEGVAAHSLRCDALGYEHGDGFSEGVQAAC
jgi:hypothetical protein